MIDVVIYESGNGGDLSFANTDIATTDGVFNMPYLSHFGGNTEQSTNEEREESEEDFSWWGNTFLEEQAQFNSSLEKALTTNALNSAGRALIENDSKKDLENISEIGTVNSIVSITGNNKIKISDSILKEKKITTYNYLFDAVKQELIEERTL